ncbi:hypothetical protein ONZ51_g13137 [Trametes cubensis]|uniref:Uncharacterized protein n=1 Tax=Trametes cubensis TaxID=1111947 RepID=A0AAD7TH21_9APHY|nr:hypothetical protein ONZ51_g13137 [Trametes cubensis]
MHLVRAAREAEEAARRAQEEAEEAARRARAEAEAEEAARRAREEAERAAREEAEKAARGEKERAEQEEADQHMRAICRLYELKWVELKTNRTLKNIVTFGEFPFPVFTYSLADPADITLERVRAFVFHPFRESIAGKTPKEILKVEVLRWHPDKFDSFIGPKVRDEDWEKTKEAAGLVARWLTTLMSEI